MIFFFILRIRQKKFYFIYESVDEGSQSRVRSGKSDEKQNSGIEELQDSQNSVRPSNYLMDSALHLSAYFM